MISPLFIAVVVVATCGLIYELVLGSLASYLLGDSVSQFSLIIGTYLFAMGIGSYLAKFIKKGLIQKFIQIEVIVGLIGGVSAVILFYIFSLDSNFRFILFSFVVIIGILVGLEIPLLLRILKDQIEFKDLVSKVLALDYVGALAASILFPIVLVPKLGLVRSSLFFGALNVLVAIWVLYIFRHRIANVGSQIFAATGVFTFLIGLMFFSERLTAVADTIYLGDPIIISERSRYQKVTVTNYKNDVKLYLNGHLQFSSKDEYRYHEALVYPALTNVQNPKNVLVLGGGDGLAVRELLKDDRVDSITVVDLDPIVTRLFKENELLRSLNSSALLSDKVTILNEDAFLFLETADKKFDLIVIDLPDPNNYSIGKLYTDTFFNRLAAVLKPDGLAVMQSTSPYYARYSFWCVVHTAQSVGFKTIPFHAYVPSFGEWGFFIMSKQTRKLNHDNYPADLRYLTKETAQQLFVFPQDMAEVETEINRLNNQILVRTHEEEWSRSVR